MPATPAQIAANRKNAAKSTGPRSPEGKAISRANGLKHGMTGKGIVVPAHHLPAIAAVEQSFAAVRPPVDAQAAVLLGQVAVMAVRMADCAALQHAVDARGREAALAQWDQDHEIYLFGPLAEVVGDAEGEKVAVDPVTDPGRAVATLDDWMASLAAMRGRIATAHDAWNAAHPDGVDPGEPQGPYWAGLPTWVDFTSAGAWCQKLDAEVDRLHQIRHGIATGERARRREQAARLAAHDASPEAFRTRRYELSAQRSFLQIFHAYERYQAIHSPPITEPPPEPEPTPPPAPAPAAIAPPDPTGPPQPPDPPMVSATAASRRGEPSAEPDRDARAARRAKKERRKQARAARRRQDRH